MEKVVWLVTIIAAWILGICLGISWMARSEHDGVIKIDSKRDEKDIFMIIINGKPERLKTKKVAIFKIDPNADLREINNPLNGK